MKRTFSIIISMMLIASCALMAQGTYYNSINPSLSSFITDLETRIRTPYTRITYDNYKTTIIPNFESRDTTASRKVVTCIYSGLNYIYTPPFAWVGGAGVNADSGFSREHTWCQSWMPTVNASGFTNMPEYSDQHHLFPVNQNNANGIRSNHPLNNVVNVSDAYINAKFGTNASGKTVYEPRAEHKGDAARALLYMTVRYNGIGGYTWTFNNLNRVLVDSLSETTEDLSQLIQWHLQDPPNKWEVDRNTYIESIQGNRNPFIDHPEYVNYINFNDLTKLSPSYAAEPANQPTVPGVSSPTSTSLTVSWTASVAGAQAPSGYLVEIYSSNDYFIPVDGSAYSDDTNISDSKGLVNVTSGTTYTFTGLTASTTYYVRIYPYNGSSSTINYKLDGTVLSGSGTTGSGASYAAEPTNHPTNFAQSTPGTSSITVTWTGSVAGAQAPSGYLLIASSSASITGPSDGTVYADDTNVADNAATVNLSSSDVTYTFTGLSAGATYYFKLYPYNGGSTLRNYKTDGSVPSVTGVTLSLEPTNYPTNFNQGTITSSSIQLTWTASAAGAQAPSGYLLIGSSSVSITAPTDGTAYGDDTNLSDNSAKVNLASNATSYTFTGLPSATTYYFKLFPYNGSGSTINFKTDGSHPSQFGLTGGSGASTPSVVVNEYLNGSNNSTEWVELLVLDDNVDMRGMRLRDYTGAGAANSGITFSSNALWQSVPIGTFIVILGGSNTQTEDLSYAGDKKVIIKATNASYFSGTSWDITGANDALEMLTSAGTHIYSLGHGPYTGLIADIPYPKASVGGPSSSGNIVRFTNISSKAGFLDSTKVQHATPASATQGTWNDATQGVFVATILPVELVSFTATPVQRSISLEWSTATEQHNHGFEIQRSSADNRPPSTADVLWATIGFVAGHGTTNAPQSYSFIDASARGTVRYRLKQVDRDGHFTYSSPVEATISTPALFGLEQNYPNPFNPTTVIRYQLSAEARTKVSVHDIVGRNIATLVNDVQNAGAYTVTWDASRFASGTYILCLQSGDHVHYRRMQLLK